MGLLLEDSKYTSRIGYIINEAAPEEPTKTEVVKEIQCGSRKRVVGKGILQSGNVKNRNGRFYCTEKELKPAQLTFILHAPMSSRKQGKPFCRILG